MNEVCRYIPQWQPTIFEDHEWATCIHCEYHLVFDPPPETKVEGYICYDCIIKGTD